MRSSVLQNNGINIALLQDFAQFVVFNRPSPALLCRGLESSTTKILVSTSPVLFTLFALLVVGLSRHIHRFTYFGVGVTCPRERLVAFRSEGRKRKVHSLAGKSYKAQRRIEQYLRYRNSRVARTVVYQATQMSSVSAAGMLNATTVRCRSLRNRHAIDEIQSLHHRPSGESGVALKR